MMLFVNLANMQFQLCMQPVFKNLYSYYITHYLGGITVEELILPR